MLRVVRVIFTFLESFTVAGFAAIFAYVILTVAPQPIFSVVYLFLSVLVVFSSFKLFRLISAVVPKRLSYPSPPPWHSHPLLLTFSVLSILCSIPAFLILLTNVGPLSQKKFLRVFIFLASVISSLVYYQQNTHRFSSLADKITFFLGIGLGPVGVVEIFIGD